MQYKAKKITSYKLCSKKKSTGTKWRNWTDSVPTGRGKLEKVREFVSSGKVRERSGENIIFE